MNNIITCHNTAFTPGFTRLSVTQWARFPEMVTLWGLPCYFQFRSQSHVWWNVIFWDQNPCAQLTFEKLSRDSTLKSFEVKVGKTRPFGVKYTLGIKVHYLSFIKEQCLLFRFFISRELNWILLQKWLKDSNKSLLLEWNLLKEEIQLNLSKDPGTGLNWPRLALFFAHIVAALCLR